VRARDGMGSGRLARALRRWWPDRNPLRRCWDRAEAALVAGLVLTFLAGGVLAALFAGRWAYQAGQRTEQTERAGWHQVPAVLLVNAPRSAYTGYGAELLPGVRARWTAPDGRRQTGEVPAPGGARAGTRIRVWMDSGGRLTGPPLTGRQVAEQAVLAAVTAPAMLALLLVLAGALAYRVLNQRRMAAWDAEWRITGPRWSSLR
jgi:hypothetical protein